MRHLIVMVVMVAGAVVAGCSKDSPGPTSPARPAAVTLEVSPADGAGGVRLDAPVTLAFSAAVERAVVERDFHLISERTLADPGCPDAATISHPDMAHCMADSAMMRHLGAYHATLGGFSWNAAGTTCTFRPGEWMAPVTRHMIHMGREMTDMLAGGMTDRHGTGAMAGHMLFHFTTLDTTGGHDGHH